ncbi:MAG: 4-alpha-glucanotransferase [Bacilli bacterium]|jgi:4-alpha-glucanotransferase|nr:4-alpha-glucanotransferase [Bacilli bacterium]
MKRGSGILLPVFSLPTRYGIGTFGKEAYDFIKFLEASGQSYWQMLPLNPTSYGDSPYQSFSAFALNPYFIDLTLLKKNGWLTKEDLRPLNHHYHRDIDYGELYQKRFGILKRAYLHSYVSLEEKIKVFIARNRFWLPDYALFMVIKGLNGGKSWLEWDDGYRLYKRKTIKEIKGKYQEEINFWIWCQFIATEQFRKLRKYARRHHISLIGDIPIYVAMDSSDVWANPTLFQLDGDRRPLKVAGVPPDYFAKTGQLWGNPIYDWEKMEKNNFRWWRRRVKKCSHFFDVLRIDHFRGMQAYWSVPAQDKTAMGGQWVLGPGMDLVNAIKEAASKMEIIAEDLGFLTPEVMTLKKASGWPGLVIYQFAFDPTDVNFTNNYLPENYTENCVAYIGTHDNDTLKHFLVDKKELLPTIYRNLKVQTPEEAYDLMISRLMDSKAQVAIFTMQDFLKEGGEYRINTPGIPSGNWHYRLDPEYRKKENIQLIRTLTINGKRI